MIKKIFIYLCSLIILSSCGFSPSFNSSKNNNFNLEIVELSGDRDTYNLIKNNLIRNSNNDATVKYKIRINTDFNKKSIAKDTTGKTTDYRIEMKINFLIENVEVSRKLSLYETFDYKNINDSVELLKYENSIKQNIANIAVEKLISQLTRLE